MKKILALTFIFLLIISIQGNCFTSGDPNRTYQVKYILDENGYSVPNERTITVTPTRIYTERNGKTIYWECEYKGTKVDGPVKGGKQVIFHVYYLTNKHIYLIISDYKLIKQDGIFYYSFVFDGQIQLAL